MRERNFDVGFVEFAFGLDGDAFHDSPVIGAFAPATEAVVDRGIAEVCEDDGRRGIFEDAFDFASGFEGFAGGIEIGFVSDTDGDVGTTETGRSDGSAVAIEFTFDLSGDAFADGPIIGTFTPSTHLVIGNAAGGDIEEVDEGFVFTVIEDGAFDVHGALEGGTCRIEVSGVSDGDIDISATERLRAVVDGGTGKGTVRNRDDAVIDGHDRRSEEADFGDSTGLSSTIDVVTEFEGVEDDEHDAGGEV